MAPSARPSEVDGANDTLGSKLVDGANDMLGGCVRDLPSAVATAWGVRERPRKGPKPALTLDRIVAAALDVADTEGLAAVSMARVATAAGTAPMSLYRHVSSKEELLDLMVDEVFGSADWPRPANGDWRGGMAGWAVAMLRAIRAHPWVVRIPVNSLPILPHQVTWFESALVALRDTGLSEARKASVILLVAGYVRNVASTEGDIANAVMASGQDMNEWMTSYADQIQQVASPERFPAIAAFIAAGVFDAADDPDDEFNFGLERILDGIGVLIEREAAT